MAVELILNSYDWAERGVFRSLGGPHTLPREPFATLRFDSKTVELQKGDLLTYISTLSYTIDDPRLRLILDYQCGRFGYRQLYTVRIKAWVVQQDGTFQIPAGPLFSCLLGWRAGRGAEYAPLPATVFDRRPAGYEQLFSFDKGIVLIVPGNCSWDAEFTWYPVVSRPPRTVVYEREYDLFHIACVSEEPGYGTITCLLLKYWDAVILPIKVTPGSVAGMSSKISSSFVLV